VGAPLVVAAFFISGHGFGHATRDIEVIRALARRQPALRVVVKTSAPAWLFDGLENVTVKPTVTDTGVAQFDSLRIDVARTASDAARFYAEFDRRVAEEAAGLVSDQTRVVVGDIPPLAFAAAASAGVPSVSVSNFTWDWIYEHTAGFDRLAPAVLPAIRRAYQQTTLALRLPMHGGFAPMAHVTKDIALIARRSALTRGDARRRLRLSDDDTIVLASFGGHGLDLDYRHVAETNGFTLVITDYEAAAVGDTPRLRCFPRHELAALGALYEDLVAAADVVVTKPGYGIVSECIANGTALVYASRGSFAEQDVMVAEMPRLLRCQFIEHEDLVTGRWRASVDAVLAQPAPSRAVDVDGAAQAAAAILAFV
jgi:L-arabinokinase